MKKSTHADIRLMVALVVAGGAALYLLKQNLSFSMPSLGDYVPSPDTVRTGVSSFSVQ
nr:hypothetical protein [uncultured bacterium]